MIWAHLKRTIEVKSETLERYMELPIGLHKASQKIRSVGEEKSWKTTVRAIEFAQGAASNEDVHPIPTFQSDHGGECDGTVQVVARALKEAERVGPHAVVDPQGDIGAGGLVFRLVVSHAVELEQVRSGRFRSEHPGIFVERAMDHVDREV